MNAVTFPLKCYIATCADCGLLFDSARRDKLTCSTACRVRAHRNGSLKRVRGVADGPKIRPAILPQVKAAEKLRPDLIPVLRSGKRDINDIMPELVREYTKRVFQALEAGE